MKPCETLRTEARAEDGYRSILISPCAEAQLGSDQRWIGRIFIHERQTISGRRPSGGNVERCWRASVEEG